MKTIILFTLIVFLSSPLNAGLLDIFPSVCKDDPTSFSGGTNCAKKVPVKALSKIFAKEFTAIAAASDNPKFSSLRVIDYVDPQIPGQDLSVKFQTLTHSYNMKIDSKGNIVSLQQGVEGSGCYYKFTIESNGKRRFCNSEVPKVSKEVTPAEFKCQSTWSKDPIRNPKNKRVSCDAFLEAMLSCSKDDESRKQCRDDLVATLDSTPKPNPDNKPHQGSEPGLFDGGKAGK